MREKKIKRGKGEREVWETRAVDDRGKILFLSRTKVVFSCHIHKHFFFFFSFPLLCVSLNEHHAD